MGNLFTTFTNCRLCINGELVEGERLVVSQDDGLILPSTGYIGGEIEDLDDAIIAPGFLELHTNGSNGFHFTSYSDDAQYAASLESLAAFFPSHGITSFWATIPTVEQSLYTKILPSLKPKTFPTGASLLGAHLEGPYLHPSKAGAHNPSLFQPATTSPTSIFGAHATSNSSIKHITLAPDLPSAPSLIRTLVSTNIKVSLGHTSASYDSALAALSAGATGLTHTLNCVPTLSSRAPGPAGLISLPVNHGPPPPYFALLADGAHLHPRTAALLLNAAPKRAMLVSDSIELAGLPDGTYPGNAQIKGAQEKKDGRIVLKGTETLVGSCVHVDTCVRNMASWTGGDIASAIRAATENVADFMGLTDRGKLEEGRRADFVVLDDEGNVKQTWIAGNRVWPPMEEGEDDGY
ncbi:Metallo-dependent hydrolase [Microthyrium microscopicum]|uniref:N-acetylglucosamine-6-phosphate deacetylase n=1 Tax=Microthyrium microscopicum TaxID=703497 RepID=A0A6A6TZ98_9PEZI|nr:Metallo-dependent hydrolase [Microthyrium microscopicum]